MNDTTASLDGIRAPQLRIGKIEWDVTVSRQLAAHPVVRELLDGSGVHVHIDPSLPANAWHEGKPAIDQAIERFVEKASRHTFKAKR